MAGIGFALRRLSRQPTLAAGFLSHSHAAVVSSGPWLFTVVALAGVQLFARGLLPREEVVSFSTVVIYNFAFSLVLSGPLVLVMTRHLADKIHARDVADVPGMLLGAMLLLCGVQGVVGVPFYTLAVILPPLDRLLALMGFFLIGQIWLSSVFLSALKSFETISAAFGVGMAAAFGFAALLASRAGLAGMLLGFDIGLAILLYVLVARIFAEFPSPVSGAFGFLPSFRKYWDLALVGFFYNAAIWVDKWIMWLSPGRKVVAGVLAAHPSYDSAMFLAYLTIIPANTLFLIAVETRFFEHYLNFYRTIEEHGTVEQIRSSHRSILIVLGESLRNLCVIQTVISYVAILVAPGLIGMARGGLELVPIFRFGVLGSLFHVFLLFAMIIAAYFDFRRVLLAIAAMFFLLNAGFTWATVWLGPAYYGYGYLLAALLTLAFAYNAVYRRVMRLPFMTFIANNPALR